MTKLGYANCLGYGHGDCFLTCIGFLGTLELRFMPMTAAFGKVDVWFECEREALTDPLPIPHGRKRESRAWGCLVSRDSIDRQARTDIHSVT